MTNKNRQIIEWVARAREGSEEAFVHIYDHFIDKIFRFVTFRIADRELAKEITSEIFFEAWQGLKRYDPKRKIKFSTWLFTIARYSIIDQYRRRRIETVSLDNAAELRNENYDLHEKVIAKGELAAVQHHLSKLPEIQQTVLHLRYLEELSYAEIADIIKKSEGNTRIVAKRALDKLRKIIRQDEKE